ncbi:MAG: hypothetical protein KGH98_01265 [Candidatus Micrarchaeota archaeon]|nr:hypothetical protein [Candidatus Micrarchaeota archaeon]
MIGYLASMLLFTYLLIIPGFVDTAINYPLVFLFTAIGAALFSALFGVYVEYLQRELRK